jgi:hypothetical protein
VLVAIPNVEAVVRAELSIRRPSKACTRLVSVPKPKKRSQSARRNSTGPLTSSSLGSGTSPETTPSESVVITASQPVSHPASWSSLQRPQPPPSPEDKTTCELVEPTCGASGHRTEQSITTVISLLTKQMLAGEQQPQQHQHEHRQDQQGERNLCERHRTTLEPKKGQTVPTVLPLGLEDNKLKIKVADLGEALSRSSSSSTDNG